jgi:hypothetical protein
MTRKRTASLRATSKNAVFAFVVARIMELWGWVIAIFHEDNTMNVASVFKVAGGGGNDRAVFRFGMILNFDLVPFDRVHLKPFAIGGHAGFGGSVVL